MNIHDFSMMDDVTTMLTDGVFTDDATKVCMLIVREKERIIASMAKNQWAIENDKLDMEIRDKMEISRLKEIIKGCFPFDSDGRCRYCKSEYAHTDDCNRTTT